MRKEKLGHLKTNGMIKENVAGKNIGWTKSLKVRRVTDALKATRDRDAKD